MEKHVSAFVTGLCFCAILFPQTTFPQNSEKLRVKALEGMWTMDPPGWRKNVNFYPDLPIRLEVQEAWVTFSDNGDPTTLEITKIPRLFFLTPESDNYLKKGTVILKAFKDPLKLIPYTSLSSDDAAQVLKEFKQTLEERRDYNLPLLDHLTSFFETKIDSLDEKLDTFEENNLIGSWDAQPVWYAEIPITKDELAAGFLVVLNENLTKAELLMSRWSTQHGNPIQKQKPFTFFPFINWALQPEMIEFSRRPLPSSSEEFPKGKKA